MEEHGWILGKLAHYLTLAVDDEHPGRVICVGGFLLNRNPPTVRGPDVAFIAQQRAPTPVRGYPQLAPDLAVEVISPSNRAAEMRRKVQDYLAGGSRIVWLVDPRNRTVTVHTSPDRASVLQAGDELRGGDVLPRFCVRVSVLLE